MVSEKDREQLFYTDDEDEAFNYLKKFLLHDKLVLGSQYVHKSLRSGGCSRPHGLTEPSPANWSETSMDDETI